MKISELDYDLPAELVAQQPAQRRDASRLLVLPADCGSCEHRAFSELPKLLRAGDLLVLNDTRVLPAKLRLRRRSGAAVEGLFLREREDGRWEVMLDHSGRLKPGERLLTRAPGRELELIEHVGRGRWVARVQPSEGIDRDLSAMGTTPLPPYIRRADCSEAVEAEDRARYQTVYASRDGAVAAPTAGLHFTEELLGRVAEGGVRVARLTLHVSTGTFQPIIVEDLADHEMHAEWYELPAETAEAVAAATSAGGRVVAVGTTSLRVLETCVDAAGQVRPGSGWTDLFIYPPYRCRVVDALLTNFHLPRTTLLALVYAFGGVERVRRAYREAIEARYRFYSYGDAMLVFAARGGSHADVEA